MTEEEEDKKISLLAKVVGGNLIAGLIYVGFFNTQDGEALPFLHAIFAFIAGIIMLFSKKTAAAGAAMILAALIIFMIGFSICAANFHMH